MPETPQLPDRIPAPEVQGYTEPGRKEKKVGPIGKARMKKFEKGQLSRKQTENFVLQAIEIKRRQKSRKIYTFYPEEGALSRHNYPKHMEFFAAGVGYDERVAMAGNRTGKTEGIGGYETTLHLMGHYPVWWQGKRFEDPVVSIAAGETGKQTRDVIQKKLIGPIDDIGTGLIPGKLIDRMTTKSGIADAKDKVYVKHSSGGISELVLMSYDQGRTAFQGPETDVAWLDEEPPMDIYTEVLRGLMSTVPGKPTGTLLLTFTPLLGISEVIQMFMDSGDMPEGLIN